MANKTLTAKVKLDTKSAEASLDRLAKKINKVQSAINKTSRKGGLEQSVDRAAIAQERLKQATLRTQLAEEKLTAQKLKTAKAAQQVKTATDQAANSANKLSSSFKASNTHANGLLTTIKRLAATYLGVMGMKAMITTSDTITSTENKLNALNGNDAGLTQNQMDKMYVSANKVRMGYTDMMANASKSMTLAGDAFQGNMDNAIRFQEIMAETYALGGASAPEMSTSMYQLIQALGAGTLAGDELRSVREGAPLAYKEIEKFAQGIYNTTDSLKDMASQGKITSEMVVAAIMNAGNEIDAKFNETSMTFGQAWNRIKNAAIKAFEPVSQMLNDMLNKAAENGAFEKIEQAFWDISKVIQIVFKVIEKTINWVIDNWDVVKNIIVAGLLVMAGVWAYQATVAVASAIATLMALSAVEWTILIIVAAVLALIYVFYLWKTGAIDTCEAIVYGILVIAAAVAIVALLFGAWPVALVAAVVAVLAIAFMFFEEVMGGIFVVGVFFKNVGLSVANFFVAIWEWLKAVWNNFIAFIVNVATACGNVLSGVFENIGIWWNNICANMKAAFWDFIATCLDAVSELAPVIEAVASAFGAEISISDMANSASGKADTARASKQDYVDLGQAWNNGMNTMSYQDLGNAWSSGMNTFDTWQDGWASTAYNNGYEWGANVVESVNQWGSQWQSEGSGFSLDNLGRKLGLDFSGSGFPSGSGYDTSGAYNQPENLLGDIANDVGDIKDSVELSEEDLEYLRKIAEMEWKKEYTHNNTITIDMTNNNSINSEGDWEGVVTKLRDVLFEELNIEADGVYA